MLYDLVIRGGMAYMFKKLIVAGAATLAALAAPATAWFGPFGGFGFGGFGFNSFSSLAFSSFGFGFPFGGFGFPFCGLGLGFPFGGCGFSPFWW
jgi:hypothetical protein